MAAPVALMFRPRLCRFIGDTLATVMMEALLHLSGDECNVALNHDTIADLTGLPHATQKQCLRRLADAGLIVPHRGNRYKPPSVSIARDTLTVALNTEPAGRSASTALTLPTENTLETRRATWQAYRDAIIARYGIEPLCDARVRSQIKQIVERVGADAPELVRFYVAHNDRWIVGNGHSIGILLSKLDGLYIQWKSGQTMTTQRATTIEKVGTYMDVLRRMTEHENGTA